MAAGPRTAHTIRPYRYYLSLRCEETSSYFDRTQRQMSIPRGRVGRSGRAVGPDKQWGTDQFRQKNPRTSSHYTQYGNHRGFDAFRSARYPGEPAPCKPFQRSAANARIIVIRCSRSSFSTARLSRSVADRSSDSVTQSTKPVSLLFSIPHAVVRLHFSQEPSSDHVGD